MGSDGCQSMFVEGDLPEAMLLRKDVFPKTLLPTAGSDRNLAMAVVAEREFLISVLRRHRALLFRGFDLASIEDFDRAVAAFDWENHQSFQGAITRKQLTDRVYTANDFSPELAINFHHEIGTREFPPSKIFFYCLEPSPEGGETAIMASDLLVEKMEEKMPEVMAKVAEIGFVHVFKTFCVTDVTKGVLSNSWQSYMATDDEDEASRRATKMMGCNAAAFFSDGRAEFTVGPLNPVKERGGRRVWIVPALGFSDEANLVSNTFGDGSAFPREAIDTYRKIMEENCVVIKWQKGDVLLVDNLAVQHSLRPGKPPRRVFVSMCE